DQSGHVGIGLGKAHEVPEAIRKGIEAAKKDLVGIALMQTSIPHEVVGRFGSSRVMLRPASQGTGVVAGRAARAVLEAAGVRDVLSKSLGSDNPHNVVKATLRGLQSLRAPEDVVRTRGIRQEGLAAQGA
ncbi:MAG: 30S ribosomal protein S5, partial [candidate division NC10 bacterium]|nr:30S ribosomal protein S5 [candidate division NC10 bacterium]